MRRGDERYHFIPNSTHTKKHPRKSITRYEKRNTKCEFDRHSLWQPVYENNYFLEDRERLTTGCDLLFLL
jgi:hypothetical protein